MGKIVILMLLYIASFLPAALAQQLTQSAEDSLNYFITINNHRDFIIKLDHLSNLPLTIADSNSLLRLNYYVKKDLQYINETQRIQFRGTSMRLAHKTVKLLGDYHEGLIIYLIAHENVQDKNVLDSLAWYIENEISNIYTMRGDFEKADYFSKLVENSLRHYKKTELLSRHYANFGRKLNAKIKPEDAIKIFELGYQLADSIAYPLGIIANALNLAELFNDHPELGSSAVYLLKIKKLLPEIESDKRYYEKEASYEIQTARMESARGNYSQSIVLFKKAIETLKKYFINSNYNRREFAKYYTYLASDYFKSDSLSEAQLSISKGLASIIRDYSHEGENEHIPKLYAENSFIALFELRSRIYEKNWLISGDLRYLEKSLTAINLALHVNDLIRETVISDPSKLISIITNKDLISRGISILHRLYVESKISNAFFDNARSYFTRSKSILFQEKTERNHIIDIMAENDKEKIAQYQAVIRSLYDKRFAEEVNLNAIDGEILKNQELIDEIYAVYENRFFDIRIPGSYIEYFVSNENIYALAELDGEKYFIKLHSTNVFADLLIRLRTYILLKDNSTDAIILNDLYKFLVNPITPHLPLQVVIIPDESIGYVPFEMLKNDAGNYLQELTTISYAFEFETKVELEKDDKLKSNIFCLAPPYTVREEKKVSMNRGSVYHLPFAKIEVDSIKALFGDRAFLSQSSDKKDLIDNLMRSTIFHFAGHAILKDEQAFLALNSNDDEKMQFNVNEIALGHFPVEMVVLSACETGLGKLNHGEGIRSLGRSFMESGAKCTVISLWNANDKSTADIMLGFYKHLKNGMKKDEALRQSKLDYLKHAEKKYLHPYYWAAFIPAGNMSIIFN